MSEQVKVIVFKNEAEAYMKFSNIKHGILTYKNFVLSEMVIVKKENGHYFIKDSFDSGIETKNDTNRGLLLGSFIGILGGPIGVLLGGATGTLAGSLIDSNDAAENASIIEKVSSLISDNETALIALVSEAVENVFNNEFAGTEVEIYSTQAVEVLAEIEEAQKLQKELEKEAKKKLNEEKKANFAKKIDDYKQQLVKKFSKESK